MPINVPANVNTPFQINVPTHVNHHETNVPTNVNTPSQINAVNDDNLANANTPAIPNPNVNEGTVKKLKKRKSDDGDLILPDGSRRLRKKTCRPDEDLPASTKRAKVSGKK